MKWRPEAPDGWQLVPKDLTVEQFRAFKKAYEECPEGAGYFHAVSDGYAAMLSASPPLPTAQEEGQRKSYRVDNDGFEGVQIGTYTTLEGSEGVVLQQNGTKVVHVYKIRWLTLLPAPLVIADK